VSAIIERHVDDEARVRYFKLLRPAILATFALLLSAGVASSATFGKVVPIGGHVSDLVFDHRQNVLYIANFGAQRIDVLHGWDDLLDEPIRVPPAPSTLAMSPDGRYLVVGHFDEANDPEIVEPAITILDEDAKLRRTVALESSPLAIAFGNSPQALVVTTSDFRLLDPSTGTLVTLDIEYPDLNADTLPVPFHTFPPEIIKASTGVSGDGNLIYVLAQGSDDTKAVVTYDVRTGELTVIGVTTSPELGPRVVSVNDDGSRYLAGWALLDRNFVQLAQFPYATGSLNIGGHAFDFARNLIYAQVPSELEGEDQAPVLEVLDTDNLTVRERLQLQENLAGRSVFNTDMEKLYAASDSGVTILPVGSLSSAPRVVGAQEDVLFLTGACETTTITKEIDIVDLGGGSVDFKISGATTGMRITPSSGTTPARVKIEVDPAVFRDQTGTTTVPLEITSENAVNIPMPVRVLINSREPEQRGLIVNVPGKLVDLLPDPLRDRFYVLRQDKNLLLVFDANSFEQIAALRTGNTPTQMAITRDPRYMLVANDNSQIANVYDLDTLEPSDPIVMPGGHYPRSIAVSNNSILAAVRSASGPHAIDRIDFEARIANELPTLGIFQNEINEETLLVATPAANEIFGFMPDGTVILYEVNADTVIASRQDLGELSGAYAALSAQRLVVGNTVFNGSLVPVLDLPSTTGESSGFTLFNGLGLRTTSPGIAEPGVIERINLETMASVTPTKMIESPLLVDELMTAAIGQIGQTILPFTRTLAPLANGVSIVSLSVSGLTVLPTDFDEAVAAPVVQSIVNTADLTSAVAPGGLITVFGANISPITEVASELPLPTTLGEACVTVNDQLVPLIRVSRDQIGAQLPFGVSGSASMVVRGPGGKSDPFAFTVLAGAPAVFHTGTAGPLTGLATIVRFTNNKLATISNPIHPEEYIVIYLTGLGATSPSVPEGEPAPFGPLAYVLSEPVVTLGDVDLPILYAGMTPGQVGVYQINAYIPYWAPEGADIALTIQQGSHSTTIPVRVVR